MEKLRVGVIGLGGASQIIHLPILHKLNNAEITAVCDTDNRKLNSIAKKYNISNKYSSYADLLNADCCDALLIATPNNTHHKIAIDALNKGIHVLIEKPVAINSQEAEEIAKCAEDNSKTAMVGMNLRFKPESMLIKSIINSSELGEIFYIRSNWLRKKSSNEDWFNSRLKSGGGVLLDLGISLLDLALWFFDENEAEEISFQKFYSNDYSIEDSAVGILKLKNDRAVNMEFGWSLYSDRDKMEVSVFGTKGTAHLNPLKVYKRENSSRIEITPAGIPIENSYMRSYENEIKHFIGAVKGNNPVISSVKESVSRMQIIENIYSA